MKRNTKWVLSAAFVIALLPADASAQALPEGVTAEMVAEGKTIFNGPGLCSACHGADGIGTPMAPTFTDTEWLHSDGSFDAIIKTITDGVRQPKVGRIQMAPEGR